MPLRREDASLGGAAKKFRDAKKRCRDENEKTPRKLWFFIAALRHDCNIAVLGLLEIRSIVREFEGRLHFWGGREDVAMIAVGGLSVRAFEDGSTPRGCAKHAAGDLSVGRLARSGDACQNWI